MMVGYVTSNRRDVFDFYRLYGRHYLSISLIKVASWHVRYCKLFFFNSCLLMSFGLIFSGTYSNIGLGLLLYRFTLRLAEFVYSILVTCLHKGLCAFLKSNSSSVLQVLFYLVNFCILGLFVASISPNK